MTSPIIAECRQCGQLILSPQPFVKCDACRAARPATAEPGRPLFEFPAGIFGQRALEVRDDA